MLLEEQTWDKFLYVKSDLAIIHERNNQSCFLLIHKKCSGIYSILQNDYYW
jgi:hypothetical protein